MFDFSEKMDALSMSDALHLLRRATVHPTWASAKQLAGKTPREAVNIIMQWGSTPQPPSWWNTKPEFTSFADAAKLWYELQSWWVKHVMTVPSVRERMVMMWHNHFTSDYLTVYAGQWMVIQNQLIRRNAYDYKTMSNEIVGDPAMLVYLNGNQSIKGNPNENFAREWFELFSLGIGNYTEQDIVEASRAFTGWRVIGLQGVYNAQLADQGPKTIFGVTENFDGPGVIALTLQQPACGRYIAGKLAKTFLESEPEAATIQVIADKIMSANYQIEGVVKDILMSNGFYHADRRGALIKSPADLVMGLASVFNLPTLNSTYITGVMRALTQEPFYPPTVEGWKGHHAWITSSTFPQRQRYAESFIDGRETSSSAKIKDEAGANLTVDLVAFIKQLPDSNDAKKVVENVSTLMLSMPTTEEQRSVLLDIMMAGAPLYEWDVNLPSAPSRIKFLIQAIVRMPEFQLM